ncbi:uncharacterized protein V1513DRAFT_435578 [Lipomyces chichibuensis]|uniref:uncharacterized protein n=1 Tax=Lipomyces chichibuensis TaxID=1546026 RepID=UPI003343BF06
MPPSSPFSFAAHLYPFSFPTPPPELPLSSAPISATCRLGNTTVLPTSADLAQYRLRSHVAPSYSANRSYQSRTILSSPPRSLSASSSSSGTSRSEYDITSSPSEVLFSPAPHATTGRASSPSDNEDVFAAMAANITCLFWFTPTPTLTYCSAHARLPLLSPICIPTREFRLFASAILSRTQVSRTVVALALLYIYRLKLHSPSILGTPGSEYRVFTIALVLANKFLDDNTYTNKTWAQVSKLPVSEIGVMEVEFLKHVKYELAVSKEKWTEWTDVLAIFAKARKAATFFCVSVPGSPVSHPTPPPLPISSPASLTPSRKRKAVEDEAYTSPAKRLYTQPHQQLPPQTGSGTSYYYSPTTPSSDDVLQLLNDTNAQAAFALSFPVLPKPKYIAPMTPTFATTPNTALRPVPTASIRQFTTPVKQIPLLVKNTYAVPTSYALPTSLPTLPALPQPISVAAPALAPAPHAVLALQSTTRANPFVYPVVDKHYVPVPRLMSVRQLHSSTVTDPGRW